MESKKLNTLIRSLSSTETKKLLDLLYRRKYDKDGKLIKPKMPKPGPYKPPKNGSPKFRTLPWKRKYDKDGKEIKPDFKSGKRLLKKGSK